MVVQQQLLAEIWRTMNRLEASDWFCLKITSTKNSKYNNSGLSTDNVRFSIKLPESSAWLDVSQPFSYGSINLDGDGALISTATDNQNTSTGDAGDAVHCVTFGTASVANGEYVVVRVQAKETWQGNISRLRFQLGASDDSSE